MRVCLICEGSYPYVAGGVAGWVQMLCSSMPETEFVIWAIATTREEMSEYKYVLPENVKEVSTIYLGDTMFTSDYKKIRLDKENTKVLQKLLRGKPEDVEWQETLEFLKRNKNKLVHILMSEAFYNICLEEYQESNSTENFKQYLWSFRGMYFSLMNPLTGEIPQADIYHSLSTGYAGILGSAASYIEGKPLILSEHGIYTREREEDIIRADWVQGSFKELWIRFFNKLSLITYQQASVVTSLFEANKVLQVELGCPEEKIQIIPNGVSVDEYSNLPCKNKLDKEKFNIATILRVVPIKDVKTMLMAFDIVLEKLPNAYLTIMGGFDESPEYFQECLQLIETLQIKNVEFCGRVNIKDYLPEVDLLLLSSISEGQPLAILEGMAAGKPFVCTNVGDCRCLLEGGQEDTLGRAGYIVPVMNSQMMASAILQCAKEPKQLQKMGEVGRTRVETYYRKEDFLKKYKELYCRFGGENKWQE